MSNFTLEQKEAIEHIGNPLLIVAGAGVVYNQRSCGGDIGRGL